ncbi:MAG: GNAT family N-acetyltransferase [Candidatus Limnocylindrales bacterium]
MSGHAIPRLTTGRLLLREWQDADREPFAAMNGDPRVVEHLPGPLDRAASDALVDRIAARWASDGHGLWAVERRADARFIGFVGLAAPTFTAGFTPCVEVGWRLRPDAWGHGFATEAALAALRFGFEELDLAEIVSFTVPANVRSRAVMARIGLTRDPADDFEHPNLPEGHPLRQHVLYRLGRDAWLARPRARVASKPASPPTNAGRSDRVEGPVRRSLARPARRRA